ncbi:ZIP family zinc transporter [Paucibacter oligotrophus]|uniref:ZIP family zinc transporter n=1 Tax=Roseateles oligotrophus TaxID=1769250 RepID=A0A840L698_9BURK|nr:ZIP family metal transporter [Roseateles oligotrophus]MBB4841738.1 ZIP family zinc transporter [Roseateles oligotrophus]
MPSTAVLPAAAETAPPTTLGLRLRPRQLLGLAIVAAGALAGLALAWAQLRTFPHTGQALQAGAVAALATALGVLPILLARAPSQQTLDGLLGFGAGVMLAACCFSLLIPALQAAQETGRWLGALQVGAGLLLGAGAMMGLERVLPHEHFYGGAGTLGPARLRRLWLFVFAIALHNIPEGLAIGVAAAGTDASRAAALATGIAIQDLPEGLVVALALVSVGMRRRYAALVGAASGLVEPVAAVLGAAALGQGSALLPWGLAMAGGAMLFVISHEIIPESHRQGHERHATGGLLLGFVLMMVLDTALA